MTAEAKCYGVKVRKDEADPFRRVEYILDAEGMKPARMDFEAGTFDYGDWADVWFVRDNYPCMVKFTGVEDYALDPTDYEKKADGTPSDVASATYEGNAMSAVPTVWLKAWEDTGYQYFVVSEESFEGAYAYAHTRGDGSVAQKLYLPLFEGSLHEGVLRSLKGFAPETDTTAEEEFAAAAANGEGWTALPWAASNLIAVLCLIMGKSDDCQAVFGQGHSANGTTAEDMTVSGAVADKGQFFGSDDMMTPVKVFHLENFWGNRIDRVAGIVNDHGAVKVKMSAPYSLADFSEYVDTGVRPANPDGSMGAMRFLSESLACQYGRIPVGAGGSGDTYQCDGFVFKNDMLAVATHGGRAGKEAVCGCWFMNLADAVGHAAWHLGASPCIVGRE